MTCRQGIPEVWIVDLENKCLHVFTGAAETGYQQTQTLADPAVRTLGALPNCPVAQRIVLITRYRWSATKDYRGTR